MSLAGILASGVAIADNVTESLQDKLVVHTAWIGQGGDGTPSFASPVTRKALVDLSAHPSFTKDGILIDVKATVTFLDPIPDTIPQTNQKRVQPVDPRDKILLPDGSTGPIVHVGGFVNPDTHRPFFSEIMIGK